MLNQKKDRNSSKKHFDVNYTLKGIWLPKCDLVSEMILLLITGYLLKLAYEKIYAYQTWTIRIIYQNYFKILADLQNWVKKS